MTTLDNKNTSESILDVKTFKKHSLDILCVLSEYVGLFVWVLIRVVVYTPDSSVSYLKMKENKFLIS